jgi:hypothetical protein
MTNEQINIAIAEACGWFNCILPSQDEYHLMTDLVLGRAMGKPIGRNFSLHKDGSHYPLPNYCNDLNAMHEAVREVFTGSHMQLDYSITLIFVIKKSSPICKRFFSDFDLATATARLHAETFLRILGKWEGAK